MKHIAQATFTVLDAGKIRMPVLKTRAYCGAVVLVSDTDYHNPTCDECIDSKVWEDIDNMGRRD